jgi:hypothetical protein
MSALIQHEAFAEAAAEAGVYRDFELDAMHVDANEKIFDDDDMWKVYDAGN